MTGSAGAVFADAALLETGWVSNVRLSFADGHIAAIETGAKMRSGDERHAAIVPGMGNLHSHAFQRGMAGAAEVRGRGEDSFWSWRKAMYDVALSYTPDDIEAVASQLYMEMLEAGFTRVGEFHYLHNDRDGSHYADIAELAGRIAAASVDTGISLTLLPVFYAHAGFGGMAPGEGQRRFIHSLDSYARLMEASRSIVSRLPGGRIGIAPHSLRAVTPQELAAILPLAENGPIHIHVAEQVGEVEHSLLWSGARPVEWLLANAPVNHQWTLIHATHLTAAETEAMAKTGATAGLCPITEANLGDGTFPARSFLDAGGRFGIGSDSNILISLSDELRQLEYSQRLVHLGRNIIAEPGQSTGERLFIEAVLGGAASLQGSSGLKVGNEADMVSLDTRDVPFLPAQRLPDQWIFAGGIRVDCVWARGRKQVENGRHVHRERISARFRAMMADMLPQFARAHVAARRRNTRLSRRSRQPPPCTSRSSARSKAGSFPANGHPATGCPFKLISPRPMACPA